MKISRFDAEVGTQVSAFGSQKLVISRIALFTRETVMHCMTLDADGQVGFHQAVQNQLFLIVAGAGWARGADEFEHAISAGEAVYWHAGEWHGIRTAQGLMAIVLEGPDVTVLEPRTMG